MEVAVPKYSMPSPNVTDSKPEQRPNASSSMVSTEPGMVTDVNATQPSKALEDIVLQPSLIVRSESFLQSPNNLTPIADILLPMTAFVKLEQPMKPS